MTENKYQVVFNGQILPGEDTEEVKKRLAQSLKKDIENISPLFSGKIKVLKKNASRETCEKIQKIFLSSGAVCTVVLQSIEDSRIKAVDEEIPDKTPSQNQEPNENSIPQLQSEAYSHKAFICPTCRALTDELGENCPNCKEQGKPIEERIEAAGPDDEPEEPIDCSEETVRFNNPKYNAHKVWALYLISYFTFIWTDFSRYGFLIWLAFHILILPILALSPSTKFYIATKNDEQIIKKHIIIILLTTFVLSGSIFLLLAYENQSMESVIRNYHFFYRNYHFYLLLLFPYTLLATIIFVYSYLALVRKRESVHTHQASRKSIDLSRGRPIEFIDYLGNILSFQSKILFLNHKIDIHTISKENESLAKEFIKHHKLYDTKVRLNEYNPKDEFIRLFKKNHMNIIVRLYFGFQGLIFYVLNPGRIFGGDFYNPNANTANIFSDHPGIILHELGHALDFQNRRYPGIYQFLRFVPVVCLYQEYLASKYAIEFLREKFLFHEELSSYKILYPAYSTYVFGAIFEYIPSPIIVSLLLPFIVLGHIIGRIHAFIRKTKIGPLEPVEPVPSASNFKLNWVSLSLMVAGFIIGMAMSSGFTGLYGRVIGGVIGSGLIYFIYHEVMSLIDKNTAKKFEAVAYIDRDKAKKITEDGIKNVKDVMSQDNERMPVAKSVTTNLLNLLKIEIGGVDFQKEQIQLEALVSTIVNKHQAQAKEKQQTLTLELEKETFPSTNVSHVALNSIFSNLITNAICYTGKGGDITVRLDLIKENFKVDVIDNGYGIAPKHHEKIFTKFYRVPDKKISQIQRAGIGLSIVKRFVSLLGGSIKLNSEPGKGSEFTVMLPIRNTK